MIRFLLISAIVAVLVPLLLFMAVVKQEEQLVPITIPEVEHTSTIYSSGDFIGVIKIPKIEAELPIYEDATQEVLKKGICRITGTSMFTEGGNTALAGHRSYTYGRMFNRLDELVIGDMLVIKYLGSEYHYEVYEILTVEPAEIWVLENVGKEIITLVTCTPIYVASHRLVVRAEKIR